jgi:hypothetical protein
VIFFHFTSYCLKYHSTGLNLDTRRPYYVLCAIWIILSNLNYGVLSVRLTVAQLSKEFPFFMEQGDSLPEVQKPVFSVTVTARYIVYRVT